ncbi:hypothetical protein AAFF_G00269480 [Aldrovandia affinis]|uniref:Uncharacterized protein n=1 Tax=Aldrovandia affinis TaxID=143900 RepID=A0AAD7SSA1_9TELE|nr:hypothetical protein AAFF_G00269480 [Aldrovandia affinis]
MIVQRAKEALDTLHQQAVSWEERNRIQEEGQDSRGLSVGQPRGVDSNCCQMWNMGQRHTSPFYDIHGRLDGPVRCPHPSPPRACE